MRQQKTNRQKITYGGNMKLYTNEGVITFSDSMRGKMAGMLSLGTAAYMSPTCQARQKNDKLVCAHCYTKKALIYPTVRNCYERNTNILTKYVLSTEEIPEIKTPIHAVRFEQLGETQNVLQAINYINIAKYNPNITFAVWTKNPGYYKTAFETIRKPKNLIIIYSSIFLNVEQTKVFERFPFIDKVFTVYDKEYIKAHPEIKINCGAKNCLSCMKCYKKNTVKFIHELVK